MLFSKFIFDLLDKVLYPSCNISTVKGITIEKDITYNESVDDSTADLYYKKDQSGKYPVLLNIHGGGFVAGDKKYRVGFSKDIADEGVFVMSINYLLCPKSCFPDFILQCASALDWIKGNADKYNLDLDNIMVSGDSAGAYIAAYLGLLQSNQEIRSRLNFTELPLKIKALLLYCGPYQVDELLTKKVMLNLQTEIGAAFLKADKADFKQIERLANHRYRDIINISPFVGKGFPLSFLTYAKNDFLCPGQGEPFIKLLQENNIPHRYHFGGKLNDLHCYHLFRMNRSGREAMKMTKEFIADVVNNELFVP